MTKIQAAPFVVQVKRNGRWVRFDARDSRTYGHAAMRANRFAAQNKTQQFRVYDRAEKSAWVLAA